MLSNKLRSCSSHLHFWGGAWFLHVCNMIMLTLHGSRSEGHNRWEGISLPEVTQDIMYCQGRTCFNSVLAVALVQIIEMKVWIWLVTFMWWLRWLRLPVEGSTNLHFGWYLGWGSLTHTFNLPDSKVFLQLHVTLHYYNWTITYS